MKIIFFAHYFPPLNSTGARRVLAFSKNLSRFGHEVTVITTPKYRYDGCLTDKMPDFCQVIELGGNARKKTRDNCQYKPRAPEGRSPVVKALLKFRRKLMGITGQLIDNRLLFALKVLMLQKGSDADKAIRQADIVVSSSPPWPIHLAGYFCALKYDKSWVADYRDQFSGNHVFAGSFFSRIIEEWIDRHLLKLAKMITVVSEPMADYYRNFSKKIITIENGYDGELINCVKSEFVSKDREKDRRPIIIRYMGLISANRIPYNLFQALCRLNDNLLSSVRVEFYGENEMLKRFLKNRFPVLETIVKLSGQVPYRESLRLMFESDALFFIETSDANSLSAKGVLTTKLFEYLAIGKPIIAEIEHDTLAGEVIRNSGLGLVCSRNPDDHAFALERLVNGRVNLAPVNEYINSFSRIDQARRFEKVLFSLVQK